MKKVLTFIMVGLMLFASVGIAFAQEPDDSYESKAEELRLLREEFMKKKDELKNLREQHTPRYDILKEFTEEIHKINELRIERNNLRAQVIEKNDTILDLYIQARENGNQEGLKQAREVRKEIKDTNKEIRELHQQLVEERRAFKEEAKNGNMDVAREHINNMISIKTSINELIKDKIELLDQIIDILS